MPAVLHVLPDNVSYKMPLYSNRSALTAKHAAIVSMIKQILFMIRELLFCKCCN